MILSRVRKPTKVGKAGTILCADWHELTATGRKVIGYSKLVRLGQKPKNILFWFPLNVSSAFYSNLLEF